MLRQPILLLARSHRVKSLVSTLPVSAGIVTSYVPGETTESIVMRMTPEDRDEFFELMEAFR